MKGFKKCFGLLLALFIIFGLSLSVSCEDSSALAHEYDGITYSSPGFPLPTKIGDTNEYFIDWSRNIDNLDVASSGVTGISLEFKGDSYTSYEQDLNYRSGPNFSVLYDMTYDSNSNTCNALSSRLSSIFNRRPLDNGLELNTTGHLLLMSKLWTGNSTYYSCHKHGAFDSPNMPQFNYSSIPNDLQFCNLNENGCNESGLASLFTRTWVNDHVRPYSYSSDGFYLHSTAIDTDTGVHYNNTFSLSQLFNKPVFRFSKMTIGLNSYDGYFQTSTNLYNGREIEIKGAFEFDGSFAWHSGIDSTGTFVLHLQGFPKYTDYFEPRFQDIPCTVNNRIVPDLGVNWLEYSCRGFLETDYLNLGLYLEISNNDNYVFETNADWRFASVFLVTDNDDTPGHSFNSELTGGDVIVGQSIIPSSSENWFSSLTNLFGFNFVNPFAPIFNLFTDQTSCVKIPTLAGMIHSETDEVCPWFDSGTRNIVTPVLSLASMMLVFGFVVRWLGSSSGNLFEDSTNETISNVNHSGFRRYKK